MDVIEKIMGKEWIDEMCSHYYGLGYRIFYNPFKMITFVNMQEKLTKSLSYYGGEMP